MFTFTTPKEAVSAPFTTLPVRRSHIETLAKNLSIYRASRKPDETEEYHTGLIKDFLRQEGNA